MKNLIFILSISLLTCIFFPVVEANADNPGSGLPPNRDMELNLDENPASCIVAQSGSMVEFDFTVTSVGVPDTIDIWFDLGLPDGQEIGPYYIWWSVPFSAGETKTKQCLLYISPMCMPGEYTVLGRCGTHCIPTIMANDTFTFEKMTGQIGNSPVSTTVSGFNTRSGSIDFLCTDPGRKPAIHSLSVTPQPCNPEVQVRYVIDEAGQTNIRLYNLQGSLVLERKNTSDSPGECGIALQTGALPSGVYLLQVEFSGTSVQKTITIIK